jgi:CDP-diacylglycerol--glycerol-3-phosphate 3-phosphatidyltransferase
MFKPKSPESVFSIPNIITLCRLGLCLSFFVLAIQKMNPTYNFIGLGIHWLGDVLDGLYARTFKQETIVGAEIDIIADRIETLFFYAIFLMFNPTLYLPVIIYVIDFAFVDFYLSYQFTKYDIISPNYFYKVNPIVYKLNFSKVGKFCNSTVITLLLIFLPQIQYVTAFLAAVLVGVKSFSIHLLKKKKIIDKKIELTQAKEMYQQ